MLVRKSKKPLEKQIEEAIKLVAASGLRDAADWMQRRLDADLDISYFTGAAAKNLPH